MKINEMQWDNNSAMDDAVPLLADPSTGKMVCVCDYELIKKDENIWDCAGGGHRYQLDMGDIYQDKFGNFWAKPPKGDLK